MGRHRDSDGQREVVKSFSGNVQGPDLGIYVAELSAVEEALVANQRVKKRLSFIADSKAVLDQLNRYIGGNTEMPKCTFGRWRNVARLVEHQHVVAHEVLSHEAKSECSPPEQMGSMVPPTVEGTTSKRKLHSASC